MKFFRFITEVFGWIRIAISPLIISLAIALGVYIVWQDFIGFIIAIIISIAGLMTGIIWATRVWKKNGTVDFLSRTKEVQETKNDNE